MRLQIFTVVCSLSVLVLATGKVEDKDNIRDLFNAYAFTIDGQNFDQLDKILTRDATFVVGDQVAKVFPGNATSSSGVEGGGVTFKGLSAIEKFIGGLVPDSVKSYAQPTANLIKFVPPYDRDGRSDRAEAVSYTSFTFFGAGNSTKEILLPFKYVDKEIVRTNERGFGGWRINNRKVELVVSFPSTCHKTLMPPVIVTIIIIQPSILFSNSVVQYLVVDPSNL